MTNNEKHSEGAFGYPLELPWSIDGLDEFYGSHGREPLSIYSAGGTRIAYTGFESIANILIEAPTLKAENAELLAAVGEMREKMEASIAFGDEPDIEDTLVDFNALFDPILKRARGES